MNLETTLQNETVLRVFFLLLLLLPIVLCALAVWRWRGSLRVLAAILLAVQGMGLAIDINGAIQGGNLAGIWTMLAFVPSLLILLVLAAVHSLTKRQT